MLLLMHCQPTIISPCFVFKSYPLNNTRNLGERGTGLWVDLVLVWVQAETEALDESVELVGVFEALEEGEEGVWRRVQDEAGHTELDLRIQRAVCLNY